MLHCQMTHFAGARIPLYLKRIDIDATKLPFASGANLVIMPLFSFVEMTGVDGVNVLLFSCM